MKISFLIPMYNEKNIVKNLKRIIKSAKKLRNKYEIIVVDDGSTNNCREEAKRVKSKNIKVVGYRDNKGKGNALKYGFDYVTGDVVVFLDADLDIPPEQISSFLKKLKYADVVIGSKRHPKSKVNYPNTRKILSLGYRGLIKILFNLDIKDTQVGLKVFRYEVLKNVFKKVLVKKYAFDLELLYNAKKAGYRIIEAPIKIEFNWGEGKLGINDIKDIFWDTIAVFYRAKILRYYDKKN